MRQWAAGVSMALALWCGTASAQMQAGGYRPQGIPCVSYERNTTPIHSDWACHSSKYCKVPVYRCPLSPPPLEQRPPRRPACRDQNCR